MPTARLGFWAVRLLVAFVAAFVLGISFVLVGLISAGDEAFDSLWLTVPLRVVGLTAVFAGVLAGVPGVFVVVRRGERSALVALSLLVSALCAIFLVADAVSPD